MDHVETNAAWVGVAINGSATICSNLYPVVNIENLEERAP